MIKFHCKWLPTTDAKWTAVFFMPFWFSLIISCNTTLPSCLWLHPFHAVSIQDLLYTTGCASGLFPPLGILLILTKWHFQRIVQYVPLRGNLHLCTSQVCMPGLSQPNPACFPKIFTMLLLGLDLNFRRTIMKLLFCIPCSLKRAWYGINKRNVYLRKMSWFCMLAVNTECQFLNQLLLHQTGTETQH